MTDQEKTLAGGSALQDFISRLDVELLSVAGLAEWKGTRLEETALKLLPQARSVVVLAMEIYPEILDLSSPGRVMGEASLNDLLHSETDYLSSRLTRSAHDVAKASHGLGLKSLPLPATGCPTDARFMKAVFSYKHAGQAAGMGEIGWHSLLIASGFGPRLRLSCCLTEVKLEPTLPAKVFFECKECGICVKACPAGAISEPKEGEAYAINRFACSAFRNAAGGCAECMKVCPVGR